MNATLTMKSIARDLYNPVACQALADIAEEQGADVAAAQWRLLAEAPPEALHAMGSLPTLARALREALRGSPRHRREDKERRLRATSCYYEGWTDGRMFLPRASLTPGERAGVTRGRTGADNYTLPHGVDWRAVYPLTIARVQEPGNTAVPYCRDWTLHLTSPLLAPLSRPALIRADRAGLLMRRFPLARWYHTNDSSAPILLAPSLSGSYHAALMIVG